MSNIYGLRDGRTFIINPEKEEDPGKAREAKKAFLLTINPQDFETDKAWTAEAIRSLCTGLVHTSTNGKRATKKELIDRLRAYITLEWDIRAQLAQSILEDLEEGGFSSDLLGELIQNLRGKELADALYSALVTGRYTDNTIAKNYAPSIVKVIKTNYQHTDLPEVIRHFHNLVKPHRERANQVCKKVVAEKCSNRTPIRYRVLIDFAEKVLLNPQDYGWKHLSYALAIATGRRCAEVHGEATRFWIDGGDLWFVGQLKTKGRGEVPAYPIISLVAPELVIRGWERLRELGKASYSPRDVHKKLAKPLSSELPKDIVDLKREAGVRQYKDLRDVYAAKILEYRPETMSANAFLAKYLGHGEGDILTATTYQKFYLVD